MHGVGRAPTVPAQPEALFQSHLDVSTPLLLYTHTCTHIQPTHTNIHTEPAHTHTHTQLTHTTHTHTACSGKMTLSDFMLNVPMAVFQLWAHPNFVRIICPV